MDSGPCICVSRPRSSPPIDWIGTSTWCWKTSGAAWRETDEGNTDFRTLVDDLLSGQYDQPLRVVAFNPTEGWSRDASEEVAEELERRAAEGREISDQLREFIESHVGRSIGVQLALL